MRPVTLDHHRELLARIYGGKRWILAVDVLAAATQTVHALRELGATSCLCVAGSRGTGPMPDTEFSPDPIVLGVEAPDMMSGVRLSLQALAALPGDAVARVDAFDPERQARVLGTIFDDGRDVAGRRKFGARPEPWQRLEDKTVIDAFWRAAGVSHAPARVVPARLSELEAAAAELDRGEGTVWSGDNREGFNGGASYVRWVRTAAHAEQASEFFGAHCHRVRVMPFLEGIPCSIHGVVFDDYVLALRPCEMVVLQKPGESTLHYARAASFWDPPAVDRDAMRAVARRTGEHLRASVGYRGAFTIDGVLSRDGFLPTELNPRVGAALYIMTAGLPLSIPLFNAAVVEGVRADFRARELEAAVLAHVDAHRAGGGMAVVPRAPSEGQAAVLGWRGDHFEVMPDGCEPDAVARYGPSPAGGFVMVDLVAERTPIGPSAAPRVAAALACLNAHWQLGLGPLEPAQDVRGEPPSARGRSRATP